MYIVLYIYYSSHHYRKGPFLWVYPPLPYDHSSWPVYYVPWTFHLGIKRLIKFHYKWVGRGEEVHTPADAIGRDIYIYAYPFIIGKKVISVSASICCDLDSYPSIHPSIHPSMHFVSGIVAYLVSHSCCCWSFWLSSQLESSADLSHMICYFCCSCRPVLAFNFPWNKFPSGGKRGVCQVIKIEWKKI